jgi:hypothetical protein
MTELSISTSNELEDFDYSSSNDNAHSDQGTTVAIVEAAGVLMDPIKRVFGFDYSGVSDADIAEAEAIAERIRDRIRGSIIDTGTDLLAVKEKMDHGKFGQWLKFHFDMSERSAQNYMNAAQKFGSTPKVIDVLPPTVVYKLAAKSAPADLREAIIAEITAGAVPDHKTIESRLVAAKSEERRKQEVARLAKADAIEGGKQEKKMRKAAKPEDEIAAERKLWDKKKAQNERIQEGKLKKAQKLEAQSRLADEEESRNREERKDRALNLVATFRERLGSHFDEIRDEILEVGCAAFQEAMRDAS